MPAAECPDAECPDVEVLAQLLVGNLAPDVAAAHEQHLEGCASCLARAEEIAPHDALTESLRSTATLPSNGDAEIAQLIEKLRGLSPLSGSLESLDFDIRGFLHPAEQDDELGRLGGHRILELIGSGGMGIVFKAEDTRLQRIVALKVMHPLLSASKHAARRFLREARASAAFEHEHVVTIYNVGEDRGLPWLSMRLLEGESLQQRLQAAQTLAPTEAMRIALETAQGLAAAHERGLLHRDIKPENIWLRAEGDQVTIVDFGLARVADEDSLVTREGAILGTPDYMAPEQARGAAVDARCDLFSLGAVLYRMLTGVAPFSRGNMMATLHAVAEEKVAPPHEVNPDVPRRLSDLVMRLLAKSPDDRPASAEQVVAELQTQETSPDARPTPAARARRRSLAPLVLTAAALLGFAAAFFVQWTTDKGTLVVETADDTIAVSIERDQLLLRDRDSGDEFKLRVGNNRLPSGEYEIVVKNGDSPLEFSLPQFALLRGGEKRLRVYWKAENETNTVPGIVSARPPTDSTPPAWLPSPKVELLPQPGEPLSPTALVQSPAELPGVASWSIETRDHRQSVSEAVLSPDGKLLATAGYDGAIRLLDTASTELQHVLLGPAAPVEAFAFSPDGRYLAAAGNETSATGAVAAQLFIWEVDAPPKLLRRRSLARAASILAWSEPDGATLALQDQQDSTPLFYEWREDRMAANFGISGQISTRPWSHDGKFFATTTDEGVRLWDLQRRELVYTIPGSGFDTAQWSGTSSHLAAVRRQRDDLSATTADRRGQPFTPGAQRPSREPDQSEQWKLELWDAERFQLLKTLDLGASRVEDESTFACSWSPTGIHLATWRLPVRTSPDDYDRRNSTQLWDVKTGESFDLPDLNNASRHALQGKSFEGFHWSSDGESLAIVFGGQAWLTDANARTSQRIAGSIELGYPQITSRRRGRLSTSDGFLTTAASQTAAQRDGVMTVAQSMLGDQRGLTLWDLDTLQGRSIGAWTSEDRWISSLSPNGEFVAMLKVIDYRDVTQESQWPVRSSYNRTEVDWELNIFNTADGALRGAAKLTGTSLGEDFVWSPDCSKLAFAMSPLKVFDVKTVEPIALPEGFGASISSQSPLAWSPDGRYLATLHDGFAILDIESGEVQQRLNAPAPAGRRAVLPGPSQNTSAPNWGTLACAWSSDGTHIATVDSNRFASIPELDEKGRERPPRSSFESSRKAEMVTKLHVWMKKDDQFELIDDVELPQLQTARTLPVLAFSRRADKLVVGLGQQCMLLSLAEESPEKRLRELSLDTQKHVNSLTWPDDSAVAAIYTVGDSPRSSYAKELGLIDFYGGDVVSRFSSDNLFVPVIEENSILQFRGLQFDFADLNGMRRATMIQTHHNGAPQALAISTDGHYRTSQSVDDDLVYAVLTDEGEQLMLTPAEFEQRYGYKNDASKVELLP